MRYTAEGDPIILDLEFNAENISCTNDSTRDQYADGKILTTSCKTIIKNKMMNGIEYELSECESSDKNLEILFVEQ